jgi:hypothetical protein
MPDAVALGCTVLFAFLLGNLQPVELLRPATPVGEAEIGLAVGYSSQRSPVSLKVQG